MKVLITGAVGQVGEALLRAAPPGFTAIATSRAELDVTSPTDIAAALTSHCPDILVNCAAYTGVDAAESNESAAVLVNATAAERLARAAVAARCRMIHLSTDFVFDGTSGKPYAPGDATSPLGVYGRTKRDGEILVTAASPDAVILRTAWVYSNGTRNFLATMLRLMAAGKELRVVEDQVGTPTSADSVAAAVWAIAARPELAGIVHWTDAGVASWYDFAVAIGESAVEAGLLRSVPPIRPIPSRDYPTPARRPAYSVLDKDRLREACNLTPRHWRTELRRVIAERKNA